MKTWERLVVVGFLMLVDVICCGVDWNRFDLLPLPAESVAYFVIAAWIACAYVWKFRLASNPTDQSSNVAIQVTTLYSLILFILQIDGAKCKFYSADSSTIEREEETYKEIALKLSKHLGIQLIKRNASRLNLVVRTRIKRRILWLFTACAQSGVRIVIN